MKHFNIQSLLTDVCQISELSIFLHYILLQDTFATIVMPGSKRKAADDTSLHPSKKKSVRDEEYFIPHAPSDRQTELGWVHLIHTSKTAASVIT